MMHYGNQKGSENRQIHIRCLSSQELGDKEFSKQRFDVVHFQNQNGDLILTTDRSEMNLKTEINIGDKVGEPLFRDIIGCYLAGYRTI